MKQKPILLTIASVALTSVVLHMAYAQSGVLDATDFNQWTLPEGNTPANGQISWSPVSACTVTSNGKSFIAAKVGRPITIVDANPAHSETVIPTVVTTSGSSCTLQAPMQYAHSSYFLKSGTAGLQEAIDYNLNLAPSVVTIGPSWVRAGGTSAMLAAATGNTTTSVMDQRTSIFTPYIWNGTQYIAHSYGGAQPTGSVGTAQAVGPNGTLMPATSSSISTALGYTPVSSIDAQALNAQFKGPRVDVTYPDFGPASGCVNAADPTDVLDSTCAIRAAAAFAINETSVGVSPVLYFPKGHYRVNANGLTGVVVFNGVNVSVEGDGQNASIVENDSPQAALFTWANDYGISLTNIQLEGNGHKSTGDLVDWISTVASSIHGDKFTNVAGIPINLQGASERDRVYDVNVSNAPMAYNSEANTNEDYIHDFDFTFNGYTADNWYYTSNANPLTGVLWTNACPSGTPTAWVNGSLFAAGGLATYNGMEFVSATNNNTSVPQKWSANWNACNLPIVAEDRPVVYMDGDNETIYNGSIKGTQMSGINAARTTMSLAHTYEEGDSSGTITTLNYAFQAVGKMEIGHGMSALAASATTATVDDGIWQHEYVTDPAFMGDLATDNASAIFPADYNQLDCSASAYAPLLKCQYEHVNMYGYANDGLAHISQRAVGGSVAPGLACNGGVTTGCGAGAINAAITWPAPITNSIGWTQPSWVISQTPNSTYGVVTAQSNHFEMVHLAANRNVNASDTALQAIGSQWIGSPSLASADFFVGPVPDGYAVPFPNQSTLGYSPIEGIVHFVDNTIYANYDPLSEAVGTGWAKILAGGTLTIDQSNSPLVSYIPPSTAFSSYVNGNVSVIFAADATAIFSDPSAHYYMNKNASASSIYNYFKADYVGTGGGNGLNTEVLGGLPYCSSYDGATSTSSSASFRECLVQGGWQLQALNTSTGAYQNVLGVNSTGQLSGTAGGAIFGSGNQTISATGPIGTSASNVFLNAGNSNIIATLPSCVSGAIPVTTLNLLRSDVNTANLVTIEPVSGTGIELDGTVTGPGAITAVNEPPGAAWTAVCDNTVNGFYEWRIYTNRSGIANVTAALGSGLSGSVSLTSASNTVSGNATVTLSAAAGASAALVALTFPTQTHIPNLACSASTESSTGVMLPVANQSVNGLTIYAPAAGLAAGTYTVQYQCGR